MLRLSFARPLAVLLALLALALPSAGLAQIAFSPTVPTIFFPITSNAKFHDMRISTIFANVQTDLQVLANINGFHEDNQFCVVGIQGDKSDPSYIAAYVYWPTENKLILWESLDDPFGMVLSRNYMDLAHDIVASEAYWTLAMIKLPWTRADANGAIEGCRHYGTNYTIKKALSGFISIKNLPQFSLLSTELKGLLSPPDYLLNISPNPLYPTKPINKFCVIGQQGKNWFAAYIYWETEHQLILWLPQSSDDGNELFDSAGTLDLKNAVVSEEPYDPNDYRMSKNFVLNILDACAHEGMNITIKNNSTEQSK